MRLLNTTSYEFREFFDFNIPKYAILSHRWGPDEVSYKEYRKRRKTSGEGYEKIQNCCRIAESGGHQWVWIDTCCIDKSSSAELSEAINSMYRWYQDAQTCYAYLNDVAFQPEEDEFAVVFRQSKWFTRGWTLQELIAPKELHFYDRNWHFLFTKLQKSKLIASITNIPEQVINNSQLPEMSSVAQRMSWAALRTTSRQEDMAYCLLGIFDINMPLLYGEGEKAFIRLQEELIKQSHDESILTWGLEEPRIFLLASVPFSFLNCSTIDPKLFYTPTPYTVTSIGLRVTVPLIQSLSPEYRFIIPLNCTSDRQYPLALCVNAQPDNFNEVKDETILLMKGCIKWPRQLRDVISQLAKIQKQTVYLTWTNFEF